MSSVENINNDILVMNQIKIKEFMQPNFKIGKNLSVLLIYHFLDIFLDELLILYII